MILRGTEYEHVGFFAVLEKIPKIVTVRQVHPQPQGSDWDILRHYVRAPFWLSTSRAIEEEQVCGTLRSHSSAAERDACGIGLAGAVVCLGSVPPDE